MQRTVVQPQKRSQLRLTLGRLYYTYKRYLFWMFGGIAFAHRSEGHLEIECFSHQTPLLRKLKDVDMVLQYNKIINLRIAVSKLNHVTIRPGETFSFWRLVGKPTKRKGYVDGMIMNNGSFKAGIGGGLCQLSNLIYWMTIHTPLTVIERHRHGYDVFPDVNRTQPFGSGASLGYNYLDLMIRNNTEKPFQLVLEVTENDLKGAWMSSEPPEFRYEVYEQEHIFKSEYWGGYTRHNVICRRRYDLDGTVENEFVVENHALMMYSPLLPDHAE